MWDGYLTSGNLGWVLLMAWDAAFTAWASSCSRSPFVLAASQILVISSSAARAHIWTSAASSSVARSTECWEYRCGLSGGLSYFNLSSQDFSVFSNACREQHAQRVQLQAAALGTWVVSSLHLHTNTHPISGQHLGSILVLDLNHSRRLDPGFSIHLNRHSFIPQDGNLHRAALW